MDPKNMSRSELKALKTPGTLVWMNRQYDYAKVIRPYPYLAFKGQRYARIGVNEPMITLADLVYPIMDEEQVYVLSSQGPVWVSIYSLCHISPFPEKDEVK